VKESVMAKRNHNTRQMAARIKRAKRFKALLERDMTLDAIGAMQDPPISRQRVHQLIASLK